MTTKKYRNTLSKTGHSTDYTPGSLNETQIDQDLSVTGTTTFEGRTAFTQYQLIEDYQTRTISSDVDVVLLSGSGTTAVDKIKDNGTIAVKLPTGGTLVHGQVIEIMCVGDLGGHPGLPGGGAISSLGTFLSCSNTNLVGPGASSVYQFATSGSGATARYRNLDPSTSGSLNPVWDVRLFGSGSFRA